jgi:hypothetical protein
MYTYWNLKKYPYTCKYKYVYKFVRWMQLFLYNYFYICICIFIYYTPSNSVLYPHKTINRYLNLHMHINVTAYRLKKSSVCPMTKGALSSKDINKPGRLVLNILAELLRFCPNIGCSWRGLNWLYAGHCNSCEFKSKGDVFTKLDQVLLTGLVGVCVCTDICLHTSISNMAQN